jgi:hypothetical protein
MLFNFFFNFKNGFPFKPNSFASELAAITTPSLFESTTTGLQLRSGLKTLSQEA